MLPMGTSCSPHRTAQEQVPLDPPAPTQATVAVAATGLCGSDAHYYLHGANGSFQLQHPMCLGHESAGVIVAVGEQVAGHKIGDRVAIEPGIPCASNPALSPDGCEYCTSGRYNLCPALRFASSAKTTPHLDGTLQTFINWPAAFLHPVPRNVSLIAAALVEPLSVVLEAFAQAGIKDTVRAETGRKLAVLVLGAGAVGQLACATAQALGAQFIVAADINAARLAFAKDRWAHASHLIPRASSPVSSEGHTMHTASDWAQWQEKQDVRLTQNAAASTQDLLASVIGQGAPSRTQHGFDLVLECTGVPNSVRTAVYAARPGGKVVLIGMGHPIQRAFPIGAAALREVDILGVFRYAHTYPRALSMLSRKLIPNGLGNGIEELKSHAFSLTETVSAFETMRAGHSEDGKSVVKVFVVNQALLDSAPAVKEVAPVHL